MDNYENLLKSLLEGLDHQDEKKDEKKPDESKTKAKGFEVSRHDLELVWGSLFCTINVNLRILNEWTRRPGADRMRTMDAITKLRRDTERLTEINHTIYEILHDMK